ncbi:hypothetical protein SprV_0902663900 [Sparganum proliferum]
MEELLLRDQGCLRSADQSNCSSSQSRWQYPTHREDTNPTAMGRALPRRPQPSSTISDAAIARLPRVETNVDLDLPPSRHENIRAV